MAGLAEYIETPTLAWAVLLNADDLRRLVAVDQMRPIDVGGGRQALTVTEAGARDFVSRVFANKSLKAAFAKAGGPLRAICDEDQFDFCGKLDRLGKLETAKLLLEFLKGSLIGSVGLAVILSDPTLLTPFTAILVAAALYDLCGCRRKKQRKRPPRR